MSIFEDLNLEDALLRAIHEKGYETPTPIQRKAIPEVLAGRDVMGCAQTGTGKTAAFILPILQLLAHEPIEKGHRSLRALVLTPTRELAIQIGACCEDYARYMNLSYGVIYGGVSQRPQEEMLERGVDLLIATPGRLLDLAWQGILTLDKVSHFVLDEADRMLDMGFIRDIRCVVNLLPEKRQTLLFSATMPRQILSLANQMLHDASQVAVNPPQSVVEKIRQRMCFVDKKDKTQRLIEVILHTQAESVLVFSRTKYGADRIARHLTKAGITACAIHGNKSQGARVRSMDGFKAGDFRVMVATDIAARGIDIEELPLVVNYDLPQEAETYVHRIGRTGRAGAEGEAVTFCSEEELELLTACEKAIGYLIERDPSMEVPQWALEVVQRRESKSKKRSEKSFPKVVEEAPQKEGLEHRNPRLKRSKQGKNPTSKNEKSPISKRTTSQKSTKDALRKNSSKKMSDASPRGKAAPRQGKQGHRRRFTK